MKKYVYLCGMMLLCLNMMAQIDTCDMNWKVVLNDDFDTPGRYWIDSSFLSSDSAWKAYSRSLTHGNNKMIYQYSQCRFNDDDGYMELVAEYARDRILANNYDLPYTIQTYPDPTDLYYYSGRIDHYDKQGLDSAKFRYGYFEIRCKLPIHRGAFPAFWLYAANTDQHYYEEIDIFEFSWEFEDSAAYWQPNPHPHGKGNPYCFTTGIYYCDTANYCGEGSGQGRVFPMINDSLSHWHTFSCEWMPEHILIYCDHKLVNEYCNIDSIPHHPLTLKANYGIDRYALEGFQHNADPIWMEQDTMVIDYIKVFQLVWDCNTDEVIAQQDDLDDFEYTVKKSIAITSTIEPVSIGNADKVTFRTTDFFEISGPFQVDNGGEMTIIMQQCPN